MRDHGWLLLLGRSTDPSSPPGGTKVWQMFGTKNQRGPGGPAGGFTGGAGVPKVPFHQVIHLKPGRATETLTPETDGGRGKGPPSACSHPHKPRRQGTITFRDGLSSPSPSPIQPTLFRGSGTPRRFGRVTAMRQKAAMVSVADLSPNRSVARWSGRGGGLSAKPSSVLARSWGSPARKSRTHGSPV